ncbi:MAG: SDR family oxidoreductase [Pseudomonadota bacterium]
MLFLGYGYVARRLAARLIAEGWSVAGTYRDPSQIDALTAGGVEPISWEGGVLSRCAFDGATSVLISAPPGDEGCPALAAAREALFEHRARIKWIGYLSTNGVYGDWAGGWVDEKSELRAASQRALRRIRAESDWAEHARLCRLPLVVFRLPGIYGPGRSALDQVRSGSAQRIVKEGQAFSRAHVDDIAAALAASVNAPSTGDVFNIADDEPTPPQDVIEYACKLIGVTPPPLVPFNEAKLSDMARSFYADNKRVSNRLMKERLLPQLAFPTYREGLRALFNAGY